MDCIQKAVIMVIDGCRPDALKQADTPNMDSLWEKGSYSWKAQTVYPSVSLPPHCSLFWGVSPEIHGIESNEWPEDYRYKVPILFDLCKEKGLKTAMVHGWKPFNPIAKQGSVDILDMSPRYLSDDLETARSCVRIIERDTPDFAFYHFNKVDHAGGEHGWMSDGQIKAVEDCDRAIGLVIDALKRTECSDQTMIIVLADHGGHDNTHGSRDPRDMTIPWICFGPGIRRKYEIEGDIFIYDTAATVAYGLGMEIPSSWEGKPVREIFLER
ncbi:MAG: alkaline phosphatase family protein [Candidatus Latescibacteria bacterium]|nr:alkaline phosphatase family protein [Candidatus Latescibacterota bacterium]